MKIGSHNSMSYAKSKKWYMNPFRFIARCQAVSIKTQYEKYGVRLFDMRIKFNKDGEAMFAHGAMEYNEPIQPIFEYLNTVPEPVDCRILLENNPDECEDFFIQWCQKARRTYKNIKFFGGRNKYTWKEVYKFAYQGPSFLDKYSSYNTEESGKPITGTYLDDWFPFLYAWRHNRENIENGTNRDYLMIDFVNIR